MTCHMQQGNSGDIQRQLDAWMYIPTHTTTHQALRCLESRDRAVSISLYTYPEDLISQWIHVKWRLSSTSSPTDSLLPSSWEKRWWISLYCSIRKPRHSLFYSLVSAAGYNSSNVCFFSFFIIFLFHYVYSAGSRMFSFFSSTYD